MEDSAGHFYNLLKFLNMNVFDGKKAQSQRQGPQPERPPCPGFAAHALPLAIHFVSEVEKAFPGQHVQLSVCS